MRYKLFTTRFCHKCPPMKEYLSKQDIPGEFVDATTPEGLEQARKLNITAVPTVVFFGDKNEELKRVSSREEVEEFIKNR